MTAVSSRYEKLCRDHAALVQMGESYGGYDPLGKLAFLDALEAVEERWDTPLRACSCASVTRP